MLRTRVAKSFAASFQETPHQRMHNSTTYPRVEPSPEKARNNAFTPGPRNRERKRMTSIPASRISGGTPLPGEDAVKDLRGHVPAGHDGAYPSSAEAFRLG